MRSEKQKFGYIEGILSSVLNTLLFILKLAVGLSAGSIAMIADAWHTMSDTLTSIVVIIGFKLAGRPGDREHPFGHGRAELVASVIIGTMLGMVGINFLSDSYGQLKNHQSVAFTTTAAVVFAVSVILKEAIAQFSIRLGKKYDSQSLIADGWHHRSDAIASALIVVGAFVGRYFWWIDGVLGFAVSFLIIHAAWGILRDSAGALMGTSPDEELTGKINAIASETSSFIADIHHVHVHKYGDHVEVTLHARMPETMSIAQAHEAATTFERRIREELAMESTIHLEPVKSR